MASPAVLSVRIIGDAASGIDAMVRMETASGRMASAVDRASVTAGLALAGLTASALAVGDAAASAEQAAGAVDAVFGDMSGDIEDFASTAAQSVGLARDEVGNLAAVLGAQLTNMGVPVDELSAQTTELITLGADLAATFGGPTSDAVAALSSLLRGERDPIERYGVSIKQADIDAQKAAMGLDKLTGEADNAATTQATLALLLEQTASAQGQFASEADTASGAQERANAEWRNAQIALGEQLLPVMTEAAKIAADMARWIGENTEVVTAVAAVIGTLSAGILVMNGAMKAYAAVQAIQTAAQIANNVAWLASPVTWIVLAVVAAIALLVAGVVLVIQNWDKIAAKAAEVWGAVVKWCQDVATWIGENIVAAVVEVGNFFSDFGKNVAEVFETIVGWIQDALDWFGKLGSDLMPDWLEEAMGMQSFAMTVDAPAALPEARMLFSAAEAVAGFAQPAVVKTTAAPSIPAPFAGGGSGDRPNITVNFNGVVTDKHGAAQEIKKLLDDDAVLTGRRRPEVPTW
ncbi:hypothetical protein [Streptomyces sp. AC495_CC817]|uniref:hypothetical protein n=1 Tax=Streptomyces sp. AC495_CC817 TaxID=2823900 RepID=UPI001C26D231|nr:hypothetical protein [Streptomyces sp. AC495_CC817]